MSRLHVALLATLQVIAGVGGAAAADRPNILWFVVDDMSANFSCYGETLIDTPNVDRLAAEGTRFAHAYVTAPVCSASRSALITGRYQTSIGAHHHRSGRGKQKIYLPAGVKPVPELLHDAGYYTCIGDGLNDDARRNREKGLGKTDYNFEWSPQMYDGEDWSGREADQPFFMQVTLPGGKMRGNKDAAARQLLERAAREFGAAVDPNDVQLPPYYPRNEVLLRDWAAYLESVRFTDQHVGRVLMRLEQEGVLSQTLVIFMTDHGISHARAKQFLYDAGTHVPLVMRGPGVKVSETRDDLVEHFDLAAVTLSAAGLPAPKGLHARDILAADYAPREAVFAARDRCDETVDRIRSVRTERYLYIRNFYPERPLLQPNAYKDGKSILKTLRKLHRAGELEPLAESLLFSESRPAEELYDWQSDPWQTKNLATDADHAEALKEHRERLDRWMAETHDAGPEPTAMYDSDMKAYVGEGNSVVQRNIDRMKEWAAAGR